MDIKWFHEQWPNFSPKEIACRHCGEVLIDTDFMDTLQRQRSLSGPIHLSSVYRCSTHNALVGGAPLSMHKFGRAGDQTLRGSDRSAKVNQATAAGFSGIGLYRTFVHADTGRKRSWGS